MLGIININEMHDLETEFVFEELGYIIGESGEFELYEMIDMFEDFNTPELFSECLDIIEEFTSPLIEASSAYSPSMKGRVKRRLKRVKTGAKNIGKGAIIGGAGVGAVANKAGVFKGKQVAKATGAGALIGGTVAAGNQIRKSIKRGLKRSKTYNMLKSKYHGWRMKSLDKKSAKLMKDGDRLKSTATRVKADKHYEKTKKHTKQVATIDRTKAIKKKAKLAAKVAKKKAKADKPKTRTAKWTPITA